MLVVPTIISTLSRRSNIYWSLVTKELIRFWIEGISSCTQFFLAICRLQEVKARLYKKYILWFQEFVTNQILPSMAPIGPVGLQVHKTWSTKEERKTITQLNSILKKVDWNERGLTQGILKVEDFLM